MSTIIISHGVLILHKCSKLASLSDIWFIVDRLILHGHVVKSLNGHVVKSLNGHVVKSLNGHVVKSLNGHVVKSLNGHVVKSLKATYWAFSFCFLFPWHFVWILYYSFSVLLSVSRFWITPLLSTWYDLLGIAVFIIMCVIISLFSLIL